MSKHSSPIADFKENDSSVTVQIKKPHSQYVNQFLRLTCAPDLLLQKVFPNVKEITESMAACNAAMKVLFRGCRMFHPGNPDIDVIVVGDGSTPRTGALFAFRGRWRVWSIDPQLKRTGGSPNWSKINRLNIFPGTVEEFLDKHASELSVRTIQVAVHSHAKLHDFFQHTIAIPCCVPQNQLHGRPPDVSYHDWGIWSPAREVKIWISKTKLTAPWTIEP